LFNSLLDFIFCRTSFVNLKISSGIQILITWMSAVLMELHET
jgi:hypothetical protein